MAEWKRRKVFRAGAAYLALGLGVIYAADVILPRLGVPEWSVTLVIVLVGLGFPLALGLAWAFDITPRGIERTDSRSHEDLDLPRSSPAPGSVAAPRPGGAAPPRPRGAASPGSGDASDAIVVLPFADMSPGGDHGYFTDGLTEEIISDLAGVRALRVISRTSSMCLKNSDSTATELGHQLGVRYILEGSVRVAGTRLRISAQLVDALVDAPKWGERFEGSLDDVFDVQERVAREIVAALDVRLTRDEDERLSEHPVSDVRAFELYLKARDRLRAYSMEGVEALISRAIEIEGDVPALRALDAWAKLTGIRAGTNRDPRLLEEAEESALSLVDSPTSAALGHSLLGFIAYERGQQALSVSHFSRALDDQPNDADSLFYQGIAYNAAGHFSGTAEASARLLICDPLNPLSHMLEGVRHWFTGHAPRATPHLARSLQLDPENLIVRWCDGYTRALVGDVDGALEQAEWLAGRGPDLPYTDQLLSLVHAMAGESDRALKILGRVKPEHLDAHHSFHLAESYAMAGELDRGLELLSSGIELGFYPHAFIGEFCPFMEPLRALNGFDAIARRARERQEAFQQELAALT